MRKDRRGTSLIEVLVMLGPALLVLGAALLVMVRGAKHDVWNDGQLSSLDAALVANERLQHDVACAGGAAIDAATDTLTLDGVSPKRGAAPERAEWRLSRGALSRNGTAVRAAQLKAATFTREGAVLKLTLQPGETPVVATAYLPEQAAREDFTSWK